MLQLFSVLLTLIFVVAQLTHYITWSWWLVFLPVLLVYGIPTLIALGAMIVGLIVTIFDRYR